MASPGAGIAVGLCKGRRRHNAAMLTIEPLASRVVAPSVLSWDGFQFDGWWRWDERPEGAVETWPWSL